MNIHLKWAFGSAIAAALIGTLAACSDADIASQNLSTAAPFEWRGQMVQNPCWTEWY
jgi:hypothetical protein